MKSGNLIAIGAIYVDINAYGFPFSDQGLQVETETIGNDYVVEPGGSAVNFAKLCAKMGLPTSFIGKVGHDDPAQILIKELAEADIEPRLIESPDVQTNLSFNMTSPDGKSIMTVVGSANQALTADEVYEKAAELLTDSPYLYLGGCFKLKALLPAYQRLAKRAKQTGTTIVLDHGRLNNTVTEDEKETVRQLALLADIYLPSCDEFQELWDAASIEEGLINFGAQSKASIVVKDGSKGAFTVIDGQLHQIAPFKATPTYMIGAGDSFNAGLIAGLYNGMSLLESARFASATAALKITHPELPTFDTVTKFIDAQ